MMAYLQDKELYVLDAWAGADPSTGCRSASSTSSPGTTCSRATCFCRRTMPRSGPRTGPSSRSSMRRTSRPIRRGTGRAPTSSSSSTSAGSSCSSAARSYAGEIKKSIFTILNYMLPLQGVLSMHCSANIGADGDTALFFGLSGTGKTTLSSDPSRRLIGDDEHGWSDTRRLQLRGRLLREGDQAVARRPSRRSTRRRAASARSSRTSSSIPDTRALDLDDASLTENTRGSYPITFIDNAELSGQGGHPTNIVMLTADAFGVLPPIARLTPDGAMYHFLSGYTARVAGTEKGVTEPKATFSTCFGAPFLPLQSQRLRQDARREDRQAQGARLAGQHRLDRRTVRRRQPDEDRAHARDDHRGADRAARSTCAYQKHPRLQPRRAGDVPGRARRRARSAQHLARRRRRTTSRRRSSRRCSPRTSRRSRTTSRRR